METALAAFFIGFWTGGLVMAAVHSRLKSRRDVPSETREAVERYKSGVDRYLTLQGFSEKRIEEDSE